jgi:hypothetical protein
MAPRKSRVPKDKNSAAESGNENVVETVTETTTQRVTTRGKPKPKPRIPSNYVDDNDSPSDCSADSDTDFHIRKEQLNNPESSASDESDPEEVSKRKKMVKKLKSEGLIRKRSLSQRRADAKKNGGTAIQSRKSGQAEIVEERTPEEEIAFQAERISILDDDKSVYIEFIPSLYGKYIRKILNKHCNDYTQEQIDFALENTQ